MSKLSKNEADILRFAEMHGQYTVFGIVAVQAARRLVAEGMVAKVSDDADRDGIGSYTVKHREMAA